MRLARVRWGSYCRTWGNSNMNSSNSTHNGSHDRIRELEDRIAGLQAIESGLLRSQRNLKDAERLAKLGHWELDLVGNKLVWSDEIYRIFEIEPEKFGATYEAFLEMVHPDDRELVHKAYSRSVREKRPYSINHRLLMSDGRVKFVSEHCNTDYDVQGKPIRSIGTVHDMTDRVLYEREKSRARKLEAVGTLAGGIAHDFNNLLTPILGNLELAREIVRDHTELLDLIEESRKAALRAREIARQLLTFAKGGNPVLESTDLGELIRDTADFFRSGSSVRIDYLIADDLWNADVDSGQVSQVFQNLILNAMQATADGGRISIQCSNREITVDDDIPVPSGRYLEIEIRDDGAGMDEAVEARVFEPYFTTKEEGSGLGLAMVRAIVLRHDGHVSLRSHVGQGTVFNIFLPVCTSKEVSRSSLSCPVIGALHILVVDDDEAVGRLTGIMARRLGHEVDLVTSSDRAIDLYRCCEESDSPYDLVILDLTMPGDKGGVWILEELRRLNPEVRALISSGYSEGGVLADYKNKGFVGVLKKPFTIKEMETALAGSIR